MGMRHHWFPKNQNIKHPEGVPFQFQRNIMALSGFRKCGKIRFFYFSYVNSHANAQQDPSGNPPGVLVERVFILR
jgi:hypothetical protein